jgi:hypothetical protein
MNKSILTKSNVFNNAGDINIILENKAPCKRIKLVFVIKN